MNKTTSLAFTGLKVWTITFVRGAYRYRCDPHRLAMHGGFSVA